LDDNRIPARQAEEAEQQAKYQQIAAGEIDPSKFWHDKSAGGKISSLFGLVLGGLSSGLRGGPNVALQILDRQMDAEVDAQKANLGKKQSEYSMLIQKGLRSEDAYRLAKANLRENAAAMLDKTASSMAGPEQQARAQALIADIRRESLDAREKFSLQDAQIKHMNIENTSALQQQENAKRTMAMMQDAMRAGGSPNEAMVKAQILMNPAKLGEHLVTVREPLTDKTGQTITDQNGAPIMTAKNRLAKSPDDKKEFNKAYSDLGPMDDDIAILEKASKSGRTLSPTARQEAQDAADRVKMGMSKNLLERRTG